MDEALNKENKETVVEKYFKHPSRTKYEQTYARLRFSESGDFKGSEMLIAGYMMQGGMPRAIYDLTFGEQMLLTDDQYRQQWHAARSWLKEIDKQEFQRGYRQVCDIILDEKFSDTGSTLL